MPQPNPARRWVYLAVLVAVSPLQTPAADAVRDCPAVTHRAPFAQIPDEGTALSPLTRARADRLERLDDHTVGLFGNVELQEGDERLLADEIIYDELTTEVEARGDVTLENLDGDQFKTPQLYLHLDKFVGYTAPGTYKLGRNEARGDAGRMTFDGKEKFYMEDLRYTTCPEGNDDWFFSLGSLELDKSRNIGTARNAVIKLKGKPIFYWPWVRFPISDERQTGFLMPDLGSSDKHGSEIAIPFYWNIAPNYDATIIPQILSDRGLQTNGEFRYLGQSLDGIFRTELLPDDDVFEDDRYAFHYRHYQTFGPAWRTDIRYAKVSDNDYLDDFGDNLAIASLTHLPQEADAEYRGKLWNFRARALSFQTVDETIAIDDRPYDRVPQLQLSARPVRASGTLSPEFESELVNFQRDDSLTGRRLNLQAGVSWPFRKSYGFIKPKISAKHIGYDLDLSNTEDNKPDVTVPIFSLDSGLFFERDMRFRQRGYVQTLEPRLFYLHVPVEEQDDLPDFDTSLPTLRFANLFRENRFVGGDRVGDTNHLTVALTTRVIGADDGAERLRFSIGQIYFFDDREVNLPAGIDTRNTSDFVAELNARIAERWFTRTTLLWDTDRKTNRESNVFIQYQPAKDKIVNIGHQFKKGEFEQLDVSAFWPIGRRWTVQASTSYSLRDERNLESYVGFGYRSCCWAFRVSGRRRIAADDEQINKVLLQLEFTGFAEFGKVPDSPLEQSIFFPSEDFATRGPGYR